MGIPTVKEGDILLYWRVEPQYWLSERAIQLGGVVQHGMTGHEYYHVAIALDSTRKIEAIGGAPVEEKNLIYDGSFDVFRPPWDLTRRRNGLAALRADIGQQYDMWLNIDDALRILTGGVIHLPQKFIAKREELNKNCVSLLRVYLQGAKSDIAIPLNATPEDVGITFSAWKVD